MSKSNRQKEAERLFEQLLDQYYLDPKPTEYRKMKKICVEMYQEGYWIGITTAQDKLGDLIEKLT